MNAAAIGAHVIGNTGLLKTGLMASALGVTAYSRVLGKRVSEHTAVPAASGTEPVAAIVVNAKLGEQQRIANVLEGIAARIPGAARLRKGFVADRPRDLGSIGAIPSRP